MVKRHVFKSRKEQYRMKKPRVLIVTDDAKMGGTYFVAEQLAIGLNKAFDVQFGCSFTDANASSLAGITAAGSEVHDYPVTEGNLFRSTFATWDAEQLLAKTGPDLLLLVDAGETRSVLALKRVAVSLGIPYVIVINLLLSDCHERFKEFHNESCEALQAAWAIVFVSNASKDRFKALFPQITAPLCVIPNSRPDDFFQVASPEVRQAKRKELKIADDETMFLTAARIEPRKGQILCVRALEKMRERWGLANLRLVLAGGGAKVDVDMLDNQIDEAKLAGSVSRLGPRDDVSALLNASDVFVLTSYAEGMPLSIIEAMAKGRPIIATDVDGIPEQVGAASGILVPSPSISEDACIEAIVCAMKRLVERPDERVKMGAQARARAMCLFTATRMLGNYERLLSEMPASTPVEAGARRRKNVFRINFGDPAEGWDYAQCGWEQSGTAGIWSVGSFSDLRLNASKTAKYLMIKFTVTPFSPSGHRQRTDVTVDGRKLLEWTFTRSTMQTRKICLRADGKGTDINIRFLHKEPTSPQQFGLSNDTRDLSILLHSVELFELNQASYLLMKWLTAGRSILALRLDGLRGRLGAK
jgi:glycosyltransferase involved in cell wall biosynthesis